MSLGKPMALGRTAEIYPWQGNQVLKLFFDWVSEGSVTYEARVARAIHASGLPVPAVGEIVTLEDRLGLVYERVDGISMWEALERRPQTTPALARLLAELQAEVNGVKGPEELPTLKDQLEHKIRGARTLQPAAREGALDRLRHLQPGDRLCHGDLHPGNVILTAGGPVIIDWIGASRGNPVVDVARTSVLVEGARAMKESIPWIGRLLVRWFYRVYVKHTFELRPELRQTYGMWRPVVAAARLSEEISELEGWLCAQAESLVL